MSKTNTYVKTILSYEEYWCKTMGFFNPYIDPFNHFISKNVPDFDNLQRLNAIYCNSQNKL